MIVRILFGLGQGRRELLDGNHGGLSCRCDGDGIVIEIKTMLAGLRLGCFPLLLRCPRCRGSHESSKSYAHETKTGVRWVGTHEFRKLGITNSDFKLAQFTPE
jgi:hypothetical protein